MKVVNRLTPEELDELVKAGAERPLGCLPMRLEECAELLRWLAGNPSKESRSQRLFALDRTHTFKVVADKPRWVQRFELTQQTITRCYVNPRDCIVNCTLWGTALGRYNPSINRGTSVAASTTIIAPFPSSSSNGSSSPN